MKGAAGIPLDRIELDTFGPRWDRRWMAASPDGRFITAREHPVLLQLRTRFDGDQLVLESDRAGELRLPLRDHAAEDAQATIWNDDVAAHDEGDAASSYISEHLGMTARLLFMPLDARRPVDPAYAAPTDRVAFADGFPLLLIGSASLQDLNARLEEPVPMTRFRPNVVVRGSEPFAEDMWTRIRLGSVPCDVVKPCARCVVTTIDPATLAASREPLRTLARYRGSAGKVWFGQNVIHRATGWIETGNLVSVEAADASRQPARVSVP